MVTDPIADLLVRIKNASTMKHERVNLPLSNMREAVARVLLSEGYLADVEPPQKQHSLSLLLAYQGGKPAVNGFKRISKPSRRLYMGVNEIKPVKRGHGISVLSTPKGILSGKEARKQNVGGEILFEIW